MTDQQRNLETESEDTPTSGEARSADTHTQRLSSDQTEGSTAAETEEPRAIEKLYNLSINNKVEELRNHAREATFITGRLALAGQLTVFFASPNTGKTLLTLRLLAEAIANNTLGKHVYHINLDDTFEGQLEKAELGIRHGFQTLTPQEFQEPFAHFFELVNALVTEGSARESVFILDTLKKFTDVMDKKASSAFMSTCRKLTSAGGSIIALAHTNKHKDAEGKAIPAGTSDVMDDCDCAYVMSTVEEQQVADGVRRFVEFKRQKSRGPTVDEALYSYVVFEEADYERMFNSVKLIEGTEADELRAAVARQHELALDQELIKDITALLSGSEGMLQKELLAVLHENGPYSRRHVIQCLKRWSCTVEEGGLWKIQRGEKNSYTYILN
jgi:hypothetical protein